MTRSVLAGAGLKQAKAGHTLGPITLNLFYATDFVDRFESQILPALRAGFIVLTDRYTYSLMARAIVRGADPQPGAWAIHRGEKVRFYDCRLGPAGGDEPGRLIGIDDGAEISLAGGRLIAKRLRLGDGGKQSPAELARAGRIAIGDRFEPAEARR